MATTDEILSSAKALISNPDRWTKGAFARDKHGQPTGSSSDRAVCWCARGAVRNFDEDSRVYLNGKAYAERLLDAAAGCEMADFNDTHDHANVMAVFDKAIKLHADAMSRFDEAAKGDQSCD